jgi:hypothetical protein
MEIERDNFNYMAQLCVVIASALFLLYFLDDLIRNIKDNLHGKSTDYFYTSSFERIYYKTYKRNGNYVYEIKIKADRKKGLLFIYAFGCHIEWNNSNMWKLLVVNPENFFGVRRKLTPKQISRIYNLLKNNEFDGVTKYMKLGKK